MKYEHAQTVEVLVGDGSVEDLQAIAIDKDGAHEQVGWSIICCLVCRTTGRLPVFDSEDLDVVHEGICSAPCAVGFTLAVNLMVENNEPNIDGLKKTAVTYLENWGLLDDQAAFRSAGIEFMEKRKDFPL